MFFQFSSHVSVKSHFIRILLETEQTKTDKRNGIIHTVRCALHFQIHHQPFCSKHALTTKEINKSHLITSNERNLGIPENSSVAKTPLD